MDRFALTCLVMFSMCAVLGTSCHHAARRQVNYTAAIERIDDQAGDHYTPANGRTSLTKLRLRSETQGVMSLLILGACSESRYGSVGDVVSFEASETAPFDRKFSFERVSSYEVSARRR